MAGIHKPVRYVPNEDDPRMKIGDRVVVKGHWAHGVELKRYYAAKDAFWAKARKLGLRSNILNPPERTQRKPADLELVGATREPGQEG
jgi:hypothetical protein